MVVLTLFCVSCAAAVPTNQEYTNSIGMKFVRIEAGTFRMGQLKTPLPLEVVRPGADFLSVGDFDEKPVHDVTITRPFYMGVCEVTNFQYELFDPRHKALRGKDNGLSQDDAEAVINVNSYNAQAFCRWLSDKEGLPYRLPTEAEWEYACRAGTKTNYNVGDVLGEEYHKNQHRTGGPAPVSLHVGRTPANAWGLHDMHGNVEEWCYDWYGPYEPGHQVDPVGYERGNCRVTRGGSHGTHIYYLRSANRMGALAQSRNWITGFRVVIGAMPDSEPLPEYVQPYQKDVVNKKLTRRRRRRRRRRRPGVPDPDKPYFKGPRRFVNIPTDMAGPVFASHNHGPCVVACPNGDLLAGWFSTVTEGGRELVVAGSRLRAGAEQWEPASQFFDTPDRNETGPGLWFDGKNTLYHFAGASFAAASRKILAMRTSTDNGATWTAPYIILPEYTRGQSSSGSNFRMQDGTIALTVDFNGSALWLSSDDGLTWRRSRGSIAGIHGGVAQLTDGRLVAFGRGGNINDKMPMSISYDLGETWNYYASEFPPIGGKQRLVLLRLREGPLFLASFADRGIEITDVSGTKRTVRGLYAAVSTDGGKTWPHKRLVSDDGPGRAVETTAGAMFTMSQRNGEYRGYMTTAQAADGVIHLLTSQQHYAFNLKWLMTPSPKLTYPPVRVKHVVETFTGPDGFDAEGWADYHSYKGGFNGAGQYTVDALAPVSGLNRIVGKGSFEMNVALENLRFNPSLQKGAPGFTIWLKDDRVRTLILYLKSNRIGVDINDKESNPPLEEDPGREVRYGAVPKSAKLRLIYNENTHQIRVFYGLHGADATTELPQSRAGLYFSKPLTESTAIYLLTTSASVGLDHYEIKPIGL
jgi:formylglycine-generating enzyme required for sulfatase activity